MGDVIEVRVIGPGGNVESDTFSYKVTPKDLADAVLSIRLDSIGQTEAGRSCCRTTPIRSTQRHGFHINSRKIVSVSVSIYNTTGKLIRTLPLGYQSAGFY